MRAMLDRVDRGIMRAKQRQMYACALECFSGDFTKPASSFLESCVQRCRAPGEKANHIVQSEMNALQVRLQRGVESCSDSARDLLPASPTDADISAAQASADKCSMKCVEDHITLLPKIEARVSEQLQKL